MSWTPLTAIFPGVRRAARRVLELMVDVGLTPHVVTTGSRGSHVVAPLRREAGFEEVRGLARGMADWLAGQHPETLRVEQRENKRRGRVYLDVMRNAYGQTAALPYAVRAKPGASLGGSP